VPSTGLTGRIRRARRARAAQTKGAAAAGFLADDHETAWLTVLEFVAATIANAVVIGAGVTEGRATFCTATEVTFTPHTPTFLTTLINFTIGAIAHRGPVLERAPAHSRHAMIIDARGAILCVAPVAETLTDKAKLLGFGWDAAVGARLRLSSEVLFASFTNLEIA